MTAYVCHVNDHIEEAVYIGRAVPRRGLKATKWANPYKITDDMDRGEVLARYFADVMVGPLRSLWANVPELRGKPLACWCRHEGEPVVEETMCHGDVLVNLLERYTDNELREMSR